MNTNLSFSTLSIAIATISILLLPMPHPSRSAIYEPPTETIRRSIAAMSYNLYDDEFDGITLNPNWYWYNENPSKWSLTASPGTLRIIGIPGDMGANCNNPTNLLLQQAPSGDFELMTKLTINPSVDYQQGGIIIFNRVNSQVDLDNYVKVDILWSSGMGGKSVEFFGEENGTIPNWPWSFFRISQSQPAFLRLTKFGDVYTGFYSADGLNWTIVGSRTITTIHNPQIGLYSIAGVKSLIPTNCSGNSPEVTVDFDFFHFNASFEIFLPLILR